MTDDLDRLDQELREYGERWRATVPTAAMPQLGAQDSAPSRGARLLVPAAAAAVVALLLGVALVTAQGSGGGPPAPSVTQPAPSASATPGTPEFVPWAPLDPTRPDLPRVTVPASPDPAAAAAAQPCTVSDLRASSAVEGAAGTALLYLTIRPSAPDVSCRLEGHPDVRFLDGGELVDIPTRNTPDDASYPEPVLVAEGDVVTLALAWGSSWCTDPVRNDRIQVAVGSGSIEVDGFGHSPVCNGVPGSGPNAVAVGSFEPQAARQERVTSPYADVEGELTPLAEPVPGEELRFLVTLTSRRGDVRLDPCPDYTMLKQGSWDDVSVARFALNCEAVPFRDADDVPYLPEGVPVRFEMRLTLLGPDSETPKTIWRLEAKDGPVLRIPTGDNG